ncbi:MAG: HD domain-containing protein, partial [Nitrospirales bacterium]
MKLAILDIGTNSIHLVLAEVEADFSYKILDRFKDMTRLGDGTFTGRRLPAAAMVRGLEVIRNLATLARNKGYERIDAIATSAVREARNGGEFIEAIARNTNLRVRVISGQEEARLIYLGVRNSMEFADEPTLVVDVGGGSVELIVGTRSVMVEGQSLKLGAIRLKDLHLKGDPPSKSSLKAMQEAIDQQLGRAFQRFKTKHFDTVVATSGMAGNLAEIIHLRRTGRPLAKLNLATATLKEVQTVKKLLMSLPFDKRLAIPGLDPKRVDTLLPATAVFASIMERTGQRAVTFSDKAIREGLLYDFIARHRKGIQAEQQYPNIRMRSVMHLARRCHYPRTHSHHVARLSGHLFDQTGSLHGLGDREREWLEYAALLHDIGYVIHSRQHHKHAYYLIKNSDLAGLTAEEIEIIANLARYHRRAMPKSSHEGFSALRPDHRRTVESLSALLRVADALDRSHSSTVQEVTVTPGKTVTMTVRTNGDPELELWTARQRVDLFERVFGRPVTFQIQPSEDT